MVNLAFDEEMWSLEMKILALAVALVNVYMHLQNI